MPHAMTASPSTDSPARHSTAFLVVTAVFITALIIANIIAVKLMDIGGWILPAGVIIFPISYILGDVLTEVYGYRRARQVIWLGFGCNLVAVGAIVLALMAPPAYFWEGQDAFQRILGYTPRLLAASFLAYLVGEFANSYVLAKLKIMTRGRWLWLRTIGSTLVGQGLDSAVFVSVAFIGTMPAEIIVTAIVAQWIAKSVYEALATPLTYGVVGFLKRHEGVDAYDHDIDFNPLKIRG